MSDKTQKVLVDVFQPWSNMIIRLKIPDIITNSQKDNEYNPLHLHGEGTVSGVLYLKIPEYLPDRKKSTSPTKSRTTDGAIEFINNACLDPRFTSNMCCFNPEPGELFLFTGMQPHQVYPFRSVDGNGERRSISFNADYITKEKLEELRKKGSR